MSQQLTLHSEQQRKRQAAAKTAGTGAALLLLFFLLKWPIPEIPRPVVEEYIEIKFNLGNSDMGSGNDQPQIPGNPAPGEQESVAPAKTPVATSDARSVETDDRAPADAPAIRNPAVSNPRSATMDADSRTRPTSNPTPAPPTPKAVFRPGARNGTGTAGEGNGADNYSPGTGQGPGTGRGDAGSLGGSPNGGAYRNDRQVIKEYYFQSELPPATVKAELHIDREGKASLRRITNGSMARYRNEILRYLPVMSFNKSDHESIITYTFIFRTSGD